ncbi:MAG: sugar phosphate isomerase/epimerase [Chthonomonadaceae bacterium]|nr:sugar phosphate isomerase/epimerase [Chthonomonadaceae bacterium]
MNTPKICLNTSTIREHKLPLKEIVTLAASAGYVAIEPWIDEIERHTAEGGSLADLHKHIEDSGLKVVSAIGFAEWIVDNPERRAHGLEVARRDMALVSQLGCTYIAAPPMGATEVYDADLSKIAERYFDLCEVGVEQDVAPMLELWGFSKTLSKLGEVAYVALESGHKNALLLTDVYHLYKGGSDPAALRLLNGKFLPLLHVNDYPAINRETIVDADRVYPGDGIAPYKTVVNALTENGFDGFFSLELFNAEYYKQSPELVLRTGFEKTKAALTQSY